jgi:hypothetical protein
MIGTPARSCAKHLVIGGRMCRHRWNGPRSGALNTLSLVRATPEHPTVVTSQSALVRLFSDRYAQPVISSQRLPLARQPCRMPTSRSAGDRDQVAREERPAVVLPVGSHGKRRLERVLRRVRRRRAVEQVGTRLGPATGQLRRNVELAVHELVELGMVIRKGQAR